MLSFIDSQTTCNQIILSNQYKLLKALNALPKFNDAGFSVFSQHEEDGLLLFIFSIIGTLNKTVVEICAGNGKECNAANLLINHKWNGLLFDGDAANVQEGIEFYKSIKSTSFWPPKFVNACITKDNINNLIASNGFTGEIDLLSLDIDGIDWYLWKELTVINPRVIVLEINHLLGNEKTLTVPYNENFKAEFTEYGSDYGGASLNAFVELGMRKGYRLIGTNAIGTNAFFLRNDVTDIYFQEVHPSQCLKHPRAIYGQTVRYEKIKNKTWIDTTTLT